MNTKTIVKSIDIRDWFAAPADRAVIVMPQKNMVAIS